MSEEKDRELFVSLQPDLLSPEELVKLIKSRCPAVHNLSSLSKDRLVRLFRQVILPLPQRLYRTNRRGKLLTARRMKSGLESCTTRGGEDTSSSCLNEKKRPGTSDRLKPTPDSSTPSKIRITFSDVASSRSDELDKIIINDRRTLQASGGRTERTAPSAKKVTLKRTPSNLDTYERYQPAGQDSIKKQRTTIKWP